MFIDTTIRKRYTRDGLAILRSQIHSSKPFNTFPGTGFDDNREYTKPFLIPELQQVRHFFTKDEFRGEKM